MFYILFLLPLCYSLKFIQHPLESRISYVEGIRDVRNIPDSVLEQCKHVAPRGNYFLKNYYGCKKLQVEPNK